MTHLHLHTHIGSILDGIGKPELYAKLAKEYGHQSVGITDHGRMGGILEFQKQMKKQDIKPLLGVEMYVSDNLYSTNDSGKRIRTKNSHIILYAGNEIGYKNLLNLNWLSMQDDHFYYMPRVIQEEIFKYSEGLVVGSACMGSKIGKLFFDGRLEEAEQQFKIYLDVFKNNFYAEIQVNELEEQKKYNELIIRLANKHGVPICLTGDVHYAYKEDNALQTISIMVSRKQTVSNMDDENFFDIEAKNLYYTNELEMKDLVKKFDYDYKDEFIDECLKNTDFIADKINYIIPGRTKFYIPSFENKEEKLQTKIKEGFKRKFLDGKIPKKYLERIKKEYEVIKDANLIDYFLIVEDYHNYAKNVLDDFCAIGRGSGGGSLLLYLLDVTALDPLEHDLIFERFLTPIRAKKDFPDIDSDFSRDVKPRIQEYLMDKYGKDRVLHICTYTTYGIKSAAKDLLRVYNVNYQQSNEFTKDLDDNFTWEENIERIRVENPKLYNFYIENKEILKLTTRMDGLVRSMGVHAGGIVILSEDAKNIIPVDRVCGEVTTAFQESGASQELDELGVIKFDLLGVKTLGIIRQTIKDVGLNKDDFYHLDLEDENIYKEVNNKHSYNLFQMTGNTYKELSKEVKPSNWEEINACNAMARPGTIKFKDDYLNGKKGINKYNDKITEVLKETYGICLYQEEAMAIFNKIGGFTLEESDVVRSIMKKLGKKDKKKEDLAKWEKMTDRFRDNAKTLKMTDSQVKQITEDLVGFSEYSFNKCFSSDMKIVKDNIKGWSPTIEEMYLTMNNKKWAIENGHKSLHQKYKHKGYGKGFSLNEDDRAILNEIVGIEFSGKRKVFLITLEDGNKIEVTSNHKFPMDINGEIDYKCIDDGLSIGNELYIKGEYEKKQKTYGFSNKKGHVHKNTDFVSNKGHKGFMNGENNFGYINGEYSKFESNYNILLTLANNNCQICGKQTERLECHHKISRKFNEIDDLIMLCSSCHKKEDYKMGRTKKGENGYKTYKSKIVSIEDIGEKNTYNVEMKAPYHTICVNNIIAKNSHCYSYSYVGLVTAYLSHYHRGYYFASSLNEEDRTEKTMEGLYACKFNGITILPPDINKSSDKFKALDNNTIIYGLTGIKNVGTKALVVISENRPYKSFKDFILNPNLRNRAVSSRAIESLIKSGCFDQLEGKESRKKLLNTLKIFWERKQNKTQDKFEKVFDEAYKTANSLTYPENNSTDYEQWEEECFGFTFFTTKFSDDVFEFLKQKKANFYGFNDLSDRPKPYLVTIKSTRILFDKNKKEMAFIDVKDEIGQSTTIPIFQSVWKDIKDLINIGDVYLMIMRLDDQERTQFGKAGFHNRDEYRRWILNISDKIKVKVDE